MLSLMSCGVGFSSNSGREFEVEEAVFVRTSSDAVTVFLSAQPGACGGGAFKGFKLLAWAPQGELLRPGARPLGNDARGRSGLPSASPFSSAGVLTLDTGRWNTGSGTMNLDELTATSISGSFNAQMVHGTSEVAAFTFTGHFVAKPCPSTTADAGTPAAMGRGSSGCVMKSPVTGEQTSCAAIEWVGASPASTSASCHPALGTSVSACPSGAVKGCQIKVNSDTGTVTTTTWYYPAFFPPNSGSADEAVRRACTSGTVLSP
jgi:hypothetical protein